mmetsp:Transcript_61047/g.175881  ORF Transcript_61047/g.175881 Transcript_61047/m.175881 type:complete len:163 (-) Transcript_61047:511-999(-)|eukprot:CAMPEP_0176154496 /NCGR_PEP_ID=MMETSP0120_2-20121206/78930_1 /TAXON_ID=160619 /ORGANISM="Kryptoperidinium foliaceum, Strain CCMP 1326" /LENGTH=162 /DNA_ID=CAMNT_0017491593 /DNA_START=37 /DNA_END=525 /DNA_ORIENTATION=-
MALVITLSSVSVLLLVIVAKATPTLRGSSKSGSVWRVSFFNDAACAGPQISSWVSSAINEDTCDDVGGLTCFGGTWSDSEEKWGYQFCAESNGALEIRSWEEDENCSTSFGVLVLPPSEADAFFSGNCVRPEAAGGMGWAKLDGSPPKRPCKCDGTSVIGRV